LLRERINMQNSLLDRLIPDGDTLSCFTSCVAQFLFNLGLDYREHIGSQLALFIRKDKYDLSNRLLFTHYHTALTVNADYHSIALRRCSTTDQEKLADRLATQIIKNGSVIVCGDAYNIPWLVKYRKVHTPHWFVIAEKNTSSQYLVQDAFSYLDYQGEQNSYSSWVDFAALVECLKEATNIDAEVHNREIYAFSTDASNELNCHQGYQWYEFDSGNMAHEEAMSFSEKMHKNAGSMLGETSPPLEGDWQSGVFALDQLRGYVSENLSNRCLYDYVDDLWVIYRSRSLYLRYLISHKADLITLGLETEIELFESNVVASWASLVKIMHYNKSCIESGVRVRQLPISLLENIRKYEMAHAMQLVSKITLHP